MKYLKQLAIILAFSWAGEMCHDLLPLPIPAAIYGMVLMLLCLWTKLVKVEDVKAAGSFLVSLLPVLFVVPAVGLMNCWDLIRESLLPIGLIILISTVVTFAVAGTLTRIFRKEEEDDA